MTSGSTLKYGPRPKIPMPLLTKSGMKPDQLKSMSGAARLEHQRIAWPNSGDCRSSTSTMSERYRPMKIGNCKNTGRQPPSGLILFLRYSSCIACDRFCMSFLYFSLMRSISGLRACMRAMFCVCLKLIGNIAPRTSTVSMMIAMP